MQRVRMMVLGERETVVVIRRFPIFVNASESRRLCRRSPRLVFDYRLNGRLGSSKGRSIFAATLKSEITA
jgi:hypothetical protein